MAINWIHFHEVESLLPTTVTSKQLSCLYLKSWGLLPYFTPLSTSKEEWVSGWMGIWLFAEANPPHSPKFKLAVQTTWVPGIGAIHICWGLFVRVCFSFGFGFWLGFWWLCEKGSNNASRWGWFTIFIQFKLRVSTGAMLVTTGERRSLPKIQGASRCIL